MSLGFMNRSDTNWAVQVQKMAKRLEMLDLGSRGIVLSSTNVANNEGADQVHGVTMQLIRPFFFANEKDYCMSRSSLRRH